MHMRCERGGPIPRVRLGIPRRSPYVGSSINRPDGDMTTSRVSELTDRELDRFAASHPRSGELRDAAEGALLSGVPMNWMTRWPGAWPVVFETAEGARLTDADGNVYVDFCLGDTGA